MNEALQNLEIKVENGGSTPQGRVSAAEWNVLVAGVKALDLAGFDETALRDYLDQYDYITRPELDKALEGIGGGSGGSGIAYPLTWSGFSQGVWDGSTAANITIPSLMSQLTNDEGYIKGVSLDMIEDALGYTPYSSTNPNGYITPSALSPYATTASVNSLLTDYLSKSGGTVDGKIFYGGGRISGDVKLTSMVVDDNANSGKLIFAGANYDYGDNDYKMGPYIQGINLAGWGKKKISFFQRDYSVEGYNADPVEVFSVMPDGEIQLNGTIHFTKEVPMIKMVENGWGQSKVMWHGWDSTGGDSLFLQVPSGAENNAYFKLCCLAPSILNTPFQVNGPIYFGGTETRGENTSGLFRIGKFDENGGLKLQFGASSGAYIGIVDKEWHIGLLSLDTSGNLNIHGSFLAECEITQHSSLVLKDVVDTRFLTLKELVELKPYSFYWKDKRDDKLHAGAVADYVMPILPEVISTDKDNIHSMNYANAAWIVGTSLTPYVSKHEKEIAKLKERVKYLESRLKEC